MCSLIKPSHLIVIVVACVCVVVTAICSRASEVVTPSTLPNHPVRINSQSKSFPFVIYIHTCFALLAQKHHKSCRHCRHRTREWVERQRNRESETEFKTTTSHTHIRVHVSCCLHSTPQQFCRQNLKQPSHRLVSQPRAPDARTHTHTGIISTVFTRRKIAVESCLCFVYVFNT